MCPWSQSREPQGLAIELGKGVLQGTVGVSLPSVLVLAVSPWGPTYHLSNHVSHKVGLLMPILQMIK